jgi:hypothetical protein
MLVKKSLIRVKDGWYNKPLILDSCVKVEWRIRKEQL